MPRAIPVRSRTQAPPRDPNQPTMTTERRVWLTLWKEGAVNALPAMASVAVKIEVRRAVETALVNLGPEDHVAEIRDLVGAVVRVFTDQLIEATRTEERETRKQKFLESIDLWIDDLALRHFPTELVGPPRSIQRRHVLAILRKRIRQTLSAELTGDESPEAVLIRMQDELACWAVEQNPHIDRRSLLRRLAPWLATTLAGGVAAASMSPELRAVVRNGTQVLKASLLPYKPIATGLWEYGLNQVDAWAKTRVKQESHDESTEE